MDCQDARTALSSYIDEELPLEDIAEVTAHLTGCGSCRRSLEELRLISTALRMRLATCCPPSPDLRARVLARLDDIGPTRMRRRTALQTRLIWRRLRRIRLRPGPRWRM